MATKTRAELDSALNDPGEGGLEDFDPEPALGGMWQRVAVPTVAVAQRWEPFAAARPAPRSWPIVLPVLVVAALVGAAMSWVGIGSRQESVALMSRGAPLPLLEPVPPPIAPAPSGTASVPPGIAPVAISPGAPLVDGSHAAATPRMLAPALDPAIEATLATVTQAYRSLDASSLTAVWPSADTARLADTFSSLKYQSLAFDRCQTRPNGPDGAVASCDASIAAAAKEGDPTLQRRHESWTFALVRDAGRWTIAGVTVREPNAP